MPSYLPPPTRAKPSEMEVFAHRIFKDVVDGHGTSHARRAKLLLILNELARENYEAGVEDGKKAPPAPVAPDAPSQHLSGVMGVGVPGENVVGIGVPGENVTDRSALPASGSAPALRGPVSGGEGGVG